MLKEAKKYLVERVENGVKGHGVPDNPKRLFILGSCVGVNNARSEVDGAIVVGKDDGWSTVNALVDEEGDPFYNLAKATLNYPYEQGIEERARWTIEQIKRSRADGVAIHRPRFPERLSMLSNVRLEYQPIYTRANSACSTSRSTIG